MSINRWNVDSRGCYCWRVKPSFHNPSWRPELTARVDGWPVSITHQHAPCWRVMETGHPSTRAVNSGSGNRALVMTVSNTNTGLYVFCSVHVIVPFVRTRAVTASDHLPGSHAPVETQEVLHGASISSAARRWSNLFQFQARQVYQFCIVLVHTSIKYQLTNCDNQYN